MGRLNRVASIKDVASGHAIAVDLGKQAIAVFNADGEFHAIGDICTHEVAYCLKRKRPTILLLRFGRGSGRYPPGLLQGRSGVAANRWNARPGSSLMLDKI